ncbi:response regulator [Methylococcus capsulatus]|jgi:two-component system KDP operon response regulator KdpE|uniref:response regulator n=1 Tax=Methylococcus capsulatus TaxID=414 RepID=UPI00031E7589|nr:response regulator [Methylococcus capsulatus]QXP91457.1 response regulator [Methylococcus capsulatus]
MPGPNPVVLVIEDDPPMRRFLRTSLRSQGFQVYEADTGNRGIIEAGLRRPEVVVLDLGLPDRDGVEVVKALREWTLLPIIVLSARSTEEHKIEALDAGADDYLTKPFGIGELLARIRVALRRSAGGTVNVPDEGGAGGGLRIDLLRRTVAVGDREIRLTPTEYRLLAALARHAGKVLTHRQLLLEVWGPSHVEDCHYLRIYMSQLRQKLETDPAKPEYLITESGVGYRLKV